MTLILERLLSRMRVAPTSTAAMSACSASSPGLLAEAPTDRSPDHLISVAQWARHLGLPRGRVGDRLTKLGWPAWRALGFPGPD